MTLEVDDLHLFFSLLLMPLFCNHAETKVIEGQSLVPLNYQDVENISLKKKYGFLHVLEDVLKNFDAHDALQPCINIYKIIYTTKAEQLLRYRAIRVLIMGSLMAGWSTRSRDMKSEKLRRNKSLTKDEIEAYWKTKKTLEEGQLDVISDARSESQEQDVNGGGARNMMQRSISMPLGEQKETAILEMHTNDELGRNNCWWTRSNWAFLNEPRVDAMEKVFRV